MAQPDSSTDTCLGAQTADQAADLAEDRATEGRATESWLALVIGNTRLHWGYFHQGSFSGDWHTPHLTSDIVMRLKHAGFQAKGWQSERDWMGKLTPLERSALPTAAVSLENVWIASVVPTQSAIWLDCEEPAKIVERSHIPLSNLYSTLGIDRAINLLGAGKLNGWPALVIDAGTAITLTAGTDRSVYGGAILPGMRLQSEALTQKTAVLGNYMPAVDSPPSEIALPSRWALSTESAIASGLIYGITATVIDYLCAWWQQFPTGKAWLTGGDAPLLQQYLQQRTPALSTRVQVERNLMFYGMSAYRENFYRENAISAH
ncbi:MAG: pantothenate kinase [Phormidesmis sp.]